jgi:hypothetical protein
LSSLYPLERLGFALALPLPSLSSRSLWRRLIMPILKDGATCSAEVAASATKVEF